MRSMSNQHYVFLHSPHPDQSFQQMKQMEQYSRYTTTSIYTITIIQHPIASNHIFATYIPRHPQMDDCIVLRTFFGTDCSGFFTSFLRHHETVTLSIARREFFLAATPPHTCLVLKAPAFDLYVF
jgi:hypothetical protein